MSHLLTAWLAASRAGNKDLLASIEAASAAPFSHPTGKFTYTNTTGPTGKSEVVKSGTVKVLVVEEKPRAIRKRPVSLAPQTIIPAVNFSPTVLLVGHDLDGGLGLPWTTGPGPIESIGWALGSMMFYIGNRVAVSVGIYDPQNMMRDLVVSYHRKDAKLRVHTGIGQQGHKGSLDGPEGRPDPLVQPFNRPQIPRRSGPGGNYGGGGYSGLGGTGIFGPGESIVPFIDELESIIRPLQELYELGGMAGDAVGGYVKEFFQYMNPWSADPSSWQQ